MSDDSSITLPEAGTLRIGPPPYWPGLGNAVTISPAFLIAASVVVFAGVILFGWHTIRVLFISVAAALLVESAFYVLAQRRRSWSESNALLTGVLFACTMPPGVHWRVPLIGAVIAVLLGQIMAGGIGNYLWHPAALGRIAVQILLHDEVTPKSWPILAPGRSIWGSIHRGELLPSLCGWNSHPLPASADAWLMSRPVDHLRCPLPCSADSSPAEALADLMRDKMPDWADTLTGVTAGAIGETCVIAILIAGLFLMWRGLLRWPLAVAAIVSAIITVALLPIRVLPEQAPRELYWLPAAALFQGLPVGLLYVCYQITAGGFLLVVFLFAPDPSSSPLTSRGHALFGLLIGTGTMLLRVAIGLPAAAYWALLIANTLVPVINRITKRRVMGTQAARITGGYAFPGKE